MQQVEEVPPPPSINLNGTLLKSEIIEQPTPISLTESSVAPPPTQLIALPITASAQPLLTSTPSTTIKRVKRGIRSYLNNKKLTRPSNKPATLLARPSPINTSTILPNPQKPVIITNSITPIIPKATPTLQTTSAPGFTTYLVVDGNQGQLVQVANDGPKPVTFRNSSGQILQATPISVVSTANQPVVSTFPINGDCSLLSNSSQTITTVRTSSSIDMQQQTTLTSDTTTLTGIIHQPTTIINGNNLSTYHDNNSSLESNNNLSLSLSQIAQKVSHRHRRSSSSSTSKKKRGRPRLYERDPLTNKPLKSDLSPPSNEIIIPNTTMIMSGQTTTFNTLPTHTSGCTPLIFSNQNIQIPVAAPSLLQQHQYSYPSLLNGTTSTNMLTSPTYNTYPSHPYPSQQQTTSYPSLTSTHNTQISSNIPNLVQLNTSPIKTSNTSNDNVTVHYIGGYVIRESNHPFSSNENLNAKENTEQIRCTICQRIDYIQRFFDQDNKFCSQLCSLKSNENKIPIRVIENPPPPPPSLPIEEPISLPPDYGLPIDPSKWSVSQVGEFIGRLTNETIRETFYESEMDGQALLLMTPEHLRETLKIKLGPSLVIASEISKLCERAKTFS